MDGRDQTRTGGDLVAFADLDQYGGLSVRGHSYPDLLHTRTVLWLKPWGEWLVVDDADLTNAPAHTLQLRWYVRGTLDLQKGDRWSYVRNGNNNRLHIQLLLDRTAAYENISRSYNWEEWINDAVGVQAEVAHPKGDVRLVTSLYSGGALDPPHALVRRDQHGSTWVELTRGETRIACLLPPVSMIRGEFDASALSGTAGCVVTDDETPSAYWLLGATRFALDGRTVVDASTPISLEARFDAHSITVEAPGETEISFYWPTPVVALLEDGAPVEFSQSGDMVRMHLTAGRHVISAEP
jgi:hypothetical protein